MNSTANDLKMLINSPSGDGGSIYFIGIGGIGMSALARYFLSKGWTVSGYDKTETGLTKELIKEGAAIHYREDVEAIPKDVEVVVYTPAVPKDHAELMYYQANDYTVVKRSDVLGAVSATSFNICIGGTHGKTTITTMVAHILRHSGYGCNAFLGGIATNYNTNFWSSANNVCVIEADEYDRSFLKLSPDIAVITAMDADHLDIYGDEASVKEAFIQFGSKVKSGGLLISKFGLERPPQSPKGEVSNAQPLFLQDANNNTASLQSGPEPLRASSPLGDKGAGGIWSYSLQNESADIFATGIKIDDGGYRFTVHFKDEVLSNIELRIGGMHNVENAVAAMAVAHALKIDSDKIKAAVADFKGVRRRFEYIIPPKKQNNGGYIQPVLVDDYAHHPEELRALLQSVRSLAPQRVVTVVFQPHLFSRTRDLADGFADALSIPDRIILLPIYPARELPIEGVTSEMILKKIDKKDKQVLSKKSFLAWMKEHVKVMDQEFGEYIVMAGAGDIDLLVQPVKEMLIG